MPPARRVRPVNHPLGCFVCGQGLPSELLFVVIDAGPRTWEFELCGACEGVARPLLARLFQEPDETVTVGDQ